MLKMADTGKETSLKSEKSSDKSKTSDVQKTTRLSTKNTKTDNSESNQILTFLKNIQVQMKKNDDKVNGLVKRLDAIEHYDYEQCEQYDEEYNNTKEPLCIKRPSDDQNNNTVDDSRFSSLAKRFKGHEITDIAINENLATTVTYFFRKGIDAEQYNTILKDPALSTPENC
ncbi:hypothetical protein DPMN_112896 [Dreissena polymorpha]|uniref:Uncharacterized protein n=1 Tax=Dreissena polymorpha TaxID=45954 RepID=A0A9D4KGH8_DREPO|nr:hypothetical protein DPMN_112896 [Dreissena polymorpha]